MHLHVCDSCGESFTKKVGGGVVVVQFVPPENDPPTSSPNDLLTSLLVGRGQNHGRGEEHHFDLCYECVMHLALALKQRKAEVKKGRKQVRQ